MESSSLVSEEPLQDRLLSCSDHERVAYFVPEKEN